jgi:glycosyltransferase involved in cell wall biosynthesis
MKVVFCLPIWQQPAKETIASLKASLPLIEAAGYEHGLAQIVNMPYISAARATMLRAALDAKADVVVFIDHDVAWRPADLVKLIQTDGDVVAGTYRVRLDDEQYMGQLQVDDSNRPIARASDGALRSNLAPAGFLKVTKEAIDRFMVAYPELCYGPQYHLSIDLFNHGVHERIWWGEDYSFSRRWRACGGDLWTVPDLSIDHVAKDKTYRGNLHQFLMRQPGGSNATQPRKIEACPA